MDYKISYCTTCKGRLHHLKETLPSNIEASRDYKNLEFLILDYNSNDGLGGWIMENYMLLIESGRMKYAFLPGEKNFHMAHAKNLAHRLASGDILVNVDADNIVPHGFAKYVNHKFSREKNIYLGISRGMPEAHGGCGGRIALARGDFFLVGGYDEKYSGWGPDDKDFDRRLSRAGIRKVAIDDYFLKKIDHGDHERLKNLATDSRHFEEYKLEDQMSKARHDNGRVVANNGNVGCASVHINFSKNPESVEPIATRVFGIGWHKTGTTSLAEAFKILGLRALHWSPTLHEGLIYNKRPHEELLKNYLVCDFPVPLYYPYLDSMFPGSKFILTTRDEASWLKSVTGHMGLEKIRFKKSQKGFPGGHAAHLCAYGTPNFDEHLYARRFRKHDLEVKDYFTERQNDLLVMDISQKEDDHARWDRICSFLRLNHLPDVPYPRSFSTKGRLKSLKKRGS